MDLPLLLSQGTCLYRAPTEICTGLCQHLSLAPALSFSRILAIDNSITPAAISIEGSRLPGGCCAIGVSKAYLHLVSISLDEFGQDLGFRKLWVAKIHHLQHNSSWWRKQMIAAVILIACSDKKQHEAKYREVHEDTQVGSPHQGARKQSQNCPAATPPPIH